MKIGNRGFYCLSALFLLAAAGYVQPAAGGPPRPPVKVLIAGENPGLRLLDKQGGKALTEVNFWRAQWSPVGAGAVCFITVRDSGPDNLRIAITDNEPLAQYIVNKLMGGFGNRFNNPPYQVLAGTVNQTNVGTSQRTEKCKTGQYHVAITWRDLGSQAGSPSSVPATAPSSRVSSWSRPRGEVLVNG